MNEKNLQQGKAEIEAVAQPQVAVAKQLASRTVLSTERGREPQQHVASLDVLRATAALMVFSYHCTTELGSHLSTPIKPTLTSGNLGVQLFFALSGYLIYATLQKGDRRSGTTATWALQFWVKRIFRIYPLYLASVFVVLVVHPDLWKWTTSENVITHLLGIHSLIRNHHGAINGSLWTLSLEIQFYMVAPFVYLVARRLGNRSLMLSTFAIWVMSYLVCRFVLIDQLNFWSSGGKPDSWSYFIGLNQLPGVFIFFAMGFLAYRLRSVPLHPSVPLCALGVFLAFPYLSPLISNLGIDPVLLGYCKTAIMSSCFVPLLIYASQVELRAKSLVRCMTWVSWLSYSFYVWHLLIIRWMGSLYPSAGFIGNGLASLALTLILADFTARYIEQPGIAIGAWISRQLENQPSEKHNGVRMCKDREL